MWGAVPGSQRTWYSFQEIQTWTMRHWCFLLALALACLVGQATGFSNGKVAVACGDMTPQHGHSSSSDPAPYGIAVNLSSVRPGDRVTVTLASFSNLPFKGFLLEARDAADPLGTSALGSFSLVRPAVSQLLECGGRKASGVSHTSDSKILQVQAVWECPSSPPPRVQFLATVVQKKKLFWVQIPGPVLTVTVATAVPPTAAALTETPTAGLPVFSSEGCGRTKSCLREPAGCSPESDQDCLFLSFSPDATGGSVLFELSGPAEGYVAAALSLDTWMGNDDVYLCVRDGDKVHINAAFVSGRTHPELAPEGALRNKAWAVSNGVIRCRFRRDVLVPQTGRFDLNQSYFLFLAHGRAQHGSPLRHDRQPLVSSSRAVPAGPPADLSGSRSPLIIKFHGVMMLVAWMWIVSTAVLSARHLRHMWPGVLLGGDRPWFQVHRGLMLLALGLIGVAFSLPFIYRGGWSKRAGYHPYLGCAVLILCVIQPIAAVFRPAPQSPRRFLFNWVHRCTGILLQILAVACCFLGFQQQALLLEGPQATGALVGWLLWILLADLGLQYHSMSSARTSNGNHSPGDKDNVPLFQLDHSLQPEVYKVEKLVMLVFQIGNVCFLGILVNAIVNV